MAARYAVGAKGVPERRLVRPFTRRNALAIAVSANTPLSALPGMMSVPLKRVLGRVGFGNQGRAIRV